MIHQQVRIDYSREVGEGWAHALETKDFVRIAHFCQPDVRSRLLWTDHFATLESADALVSQLRQWFEESDPIQIQKVQIEPVGDKVAISYRLTLREREEWLEVEQQIFATLNDSLLDRVDLLCSGFQPIPKGGPTAKQADGSVRESLASRS